MTKKKTGRPAGKKDSRPRRKKTGMTAEQRSAAAVKAAETKRRNKAKPEIETPDVTVTPYPRTGDNPNFEGVLDRADLAGSGAKATPGSEPAAGPQEILRVKDVAEWVAWPFLLWSQSQDMQRLCISEKESLSIAEPLTSILNRHGAGDFIPPDVVDGLRVAARLTPVMTDRLGRIRQERQRRAAQGSAGKSDRPTEHGSSRPVQGAEATKPREV